MKIKAFKQLLNTYTKNKTPYLFVVDFELKKPVVYKLDELDNEHIFYSIHGKGNLKDVNTDPLEIEINPISKKRYTKAFKKVKKHIEYGDSYLLNLTSKNEVTVVNHQKEESVLRTIIQQARANYKLCYKDQFISFSPESFIKIKGGTIFTYPMKGTIDASIENAEELILNDVKETREHNTIVDLLRNDLSIVAKDVTINRFRYIDKITTGQKDILQVSSEIQGTLPENWREHFGDILVQLLPAGSVSGAPKKKTVQIIKKAEKGKRGYYSGVFGVFNGETLDTAVLIRFMEHKKGKIYYRSGGGITSLSDLDSEYNELKQKIYIPK